jgi:hypothetical protein
MGKVNNSMLCGIYTVIYLEIADLYLQFMIMTYGISKTKNLSGNAAQFSSLANYKLMLC